MPMPTKAARTFPSARIPSHCGGLPVEVTLVARLDRGGGDRLIESASVLQRGHETFADELDEPSARLGGIDLANGDATSLYTFAVGANGHPFHRHAGHRVFTAISGSIGTQLRFSTASAQQIARDPREFVAALHHVDIPPDCLFTVRFGGGTWHQFVPLRPHASHPALFALSCHTNELGGELAPELRRRVLDGTANIPALTEVLPAAARALLEGASFDPTGVPTTTLSLNEARRRQGPRAILRGALARIRRTTAGTERTLGRHGDGHRWRVRQLAEVPQASLLRTQLTGAPADEDTFELIVPPGAAATASASAVLAAILSGFLESRPPGVSRLMALRNTLVKPFGLRTSPLGCPASSLLSADSQTTFGRRFPVLAQRVDATDARAEVILGADDKHLSFRSCVGVERLPDGRMRCTLGTRVRTRNAFGRLYMAVIDGVHRRYIAPAMLRQAVGYAVGALRSGASSIAGSGESIVPVGVSLSTGQSPIPGIVSIRTSAKACA